MRDELPPRRVTECDLATETPAPQYRHRRRRPRARWLPRILAALFLFCVLAAGYAGVRMYRAMSHLTPAGERGPRAWMERPFDGKRKVTLLVLGVDEKNRLRQTDGRRSDTMILAQLDLENKHIAAVSLPRDTRVRIPGRRGHDKLNAAHHWGGVPLVRQTISELVGMPIDRYVKTDVNGFRAVVDLIGPIEVNVEKRMDYDDNWGNLHIHLKPGKQLLDGEKAMGYVRFRHDASGDMGRMERQQKFLRAVARQMLSVGNLSRLPQVVEKGLEYVETDLSAREMAAVANLFREVSVSRIATATLPGSPRYIGRVSYFIMDEYRAPEVLNKLFTASAHSARAGVEVLNGNGLPGIAGVAGRSLTAAGFHVSRTGNAANYDFEKTEVRVLEGEEPDARRVAEALGVKDAQITVVERPPAGAPRQEASITVVLGKDYRP